MLQLSVRRPLHWSSDALNFLCRRQISPTRGSASTQSGWSISTKSSWHPRYISPLAGGRASEIDDFENRWPVRLHLWCKAF